MLTIVAFLAMVLLAVPAFAYDEVSAIPNTNCADCHGNGLDTSQPSGPHGGYLVTTNKCATCHSVHDAPDAGILLLPAATIKATCMTCHDGTTVDGQGVYGAIQARTNAPAESDHSIDSTNTVPGGAIAGGSQDRTFGGVSDYLTCSDCHSPHGTNVVLAFTGDRVRSADMGANISSTRLLKQKPTSYTGSAILAYGSDWCGACHTGRLSGSGMASNHEVESSYNLPAAGSVFVYQTIARLGGGTGLGGSNLGYRMEWVTATDSRSAAQDGHTPICQQCHEDSRVPTTDVPSEGGFTITTPDGGTATDNPRFQTFPHESDTKRLLVSANLCTNCHPEGQLGN